MSVDTEQRNIVAELENLFQRYPDVPKEVIAKEHMQLEGFRFTPQAIQFYGDRVVKTYHLFSWDWSPIEDMDDQRAPVKLPDTINVIGGPYKFRRMRMRPRINMRSPYLVDMYDNGLAIFNGSRGEVIAIIKDPPPVPKYLNKTFEDGLPYGQVVPPDVNVIVFRQCQHWGPDEECKFCDINENARSKVKMGQAPNTRPKDPVQVGIVCEEIFLREEWSDDYHPVQVHINGGTVINQLNRMDEVEFYMRYVEEVKARIGNRWPINLQTHPYPKDKEKYLYENGANIRLSNYEVWDPGLFKVICPGKDRIVGRDEWIRRVLDQVDIFGQGNVCPGFVAGVEMAQPWGFKTVKEAIASTGEGIEFFMRHGVIPRPISWCVEALSALGGQPHPPIEYFIELDRLWYHTWLKYSLPPVSAQPIGTGRNDYPNSAAFDMGLEVV